jgi:hypothetical protein
MLPNAFIENINKAAPELIVFSVVRNELMRIQPWLNHYRRIGVDAFAIVDNGSTDGTFEFLSSQPDVTLTRTIASFSKSRFGIDWLTEFHDRVRPHTWILFADSDEFIVYRGWPELPVRRVADQAMSEGCNAVFGFMLDMYPEGAVEDAVPSTGDELFSVAPCFDKSYHFRMAPRSPWQSSQPWLECIGGPRVRLLSSLEREIATTWFTYFIRGQIGRLIPLIPKRLLPWSVRFMPQQVPAMHKTPLVQSGTGFRYVNNHLGTGGRLFRENVVFCHFKFLADFAARVREEAQRGEHFRRGTEYIMYAQATSRHDRLCFVCKGTQRFRGADQLIELGLIRDIRPLLSSPSGG